MPEKKKKSFNVKLRNTKYVKGQPGVQTTTLTVEAPDRETARTSALAFAKKNLGDGYELS